ncbi:MAG: 3',5'-cyclic-nucleotide phosphodiesterase [Thiobacillaceae bacterium]|jgi:ribonuclease BN (tRNA processing enzyme)|nr:3',5'-cyclic-nucleotide phosphodiesterase [Thiobacillaceae bacterium]
MQMRILGCSGGIGDGRHTTSFLVDDDILIDAGSGITQLGRAELARIDHLFITHAHLDHVLALPPMLDSVAQERARPLLVHALPEVIEVLGGHLFNWHLWPDFTRVPTADAPFMRYAPLALGETVALGDRALTAIPAHHTVPAVGYLIRGARGSVIFSGDTASHPALWRLVEATDDLRHLIVETSFPNALRGVAEASRHYCPASLLHDLAGMRRRVPVWITHLKPGGEAEIMGEIQAGAPAGLSVQALRQGQVFGGL